MINHLDGKASRATAGTGGGPDKTPIPAQAPNACAYETASRLCDTPQTHLVPKRCQIRPERHTILGLPGTMPALPVLVRRQEMQHLGPSLLDLRINHQVIRAAKWAVTFGIVLFLEFST
ncbi:MAG TPA: hypothetical protein VF070_29395 [Streptosporangiaceae bacterium]